MNKKEGNPFLVWMDLEMTGLDPAREKIIEIATLITDHRLKVIAEGPNLVIHQSPEILKSMDTWNQHQHGKSGLIEEVRKSRTTVRDAEDQTLRFLKRYCRPGKSPLCGNSVHHDRKFLAKYMPRLNRFLHYRHVDVSTLKELVSRWYPSRKSAAKKKYAHRAMTDIRESIEELRGYRNHYFRRPFAS
jgi:oligoribonuclease